MTKEFKRAADIVDKIVVRSASWSELFEKHDFFSRYRYYLQITASSADPDVQLKWYEYTAGFTVYLDFLAHECYSAGPAR